MELLFGAASSDPGPPPEKKLDHPGQAGSGKSLIQAISEPAPEKNPDDAAPKPAPKPDDAAPPKPAEPEVRVRRRRSDPPPAPPPAAPTPPPAPAPAPENKGPTDDERFKADLLDEERDQLELAEYAEKANPTKYKGYAAKVTKFLKEHQDYLEKNPKATEPGSAEAEAYQVWLAKNQATLPAREQRQLELARVAENAKAEALRESDEKFSEIHDDNFRRDQEPVIKKEADQFFSQLAAEALPADLAAVVKAEGVEKAKEKFPLEYQIAAEEMASGADYVEEFRRLTTTNPKTNRRLKAFDPNNPMHVGILEFVNRQCDMFKNGYEGEDEATRANRIKLQTQMRDGRPAQFLTRDEFFKLKPEQRTGFWTFSHEQIIGMKRIDVAKRIETRIKGEVKAREAQGWVRRPAAGAAAAPPPEQKGAPPAPRPSPIAGGNGAPQDQQEKALGLLYGG